MRWPTPPTGPDGAAITNIAPGPATTPATASDFHDQRSTTAVLADGGDRPGSEQSIRQASSQRQHTFATLGSPAPARPGRQTTERGQARPPPPSTSSPNSPAETPGSRQQPVTNHPTRNHPTRDATVTAPCHHLLSALHTERRRDKASVGSRAGASVPPTTSHG